MKKYLKKIFVICILVIMLVCNSVVIFASEDNYSYEVYYVRDNGVQYRAFFTTTIQPCALVRYDANRHYLYAYVEGEFVKVTTSNYLLGDVVVQEYNASVNAWEASSKASAFSIRTTEYTLLSGVDIYETFDEFENYINTPPVSEEPSTEEPTEQPTEPPTEQPTEPPTEEPPTEEPPTEKPPTEEPPTENIDYGIAGNLVSDLIGNTKEFTPQSVMAIFVVCLVLECLSHIASALLSVGGMK